MTLRGRLYRPPGATEPAHAADRTAASDSTPAVVLTPGMSAVIEMFVDDYAAAFAEAGFVALAYDHFGFGASDGKPRQNPAPKTQMQGYRDAVAWLAAQPGVDPERIAIWGTAYSASQIVLLAAEDLPIACAVAQIPGIGENGPNLTPITLAAIGQAFKRDKPNTIIPAVASVPAIEIVDLPGGHFEVYEAGFEASSAAAIDFLGRHLMANAAAGVTPAATAD